MTVEMKTDRERVRDLFRALRKEEIELSTGAKVKVRCFMNFRCCQSCASYELATTKPVGTPVVYFHQQDNESFGRRGELKRELYLAYGVTYRTEQEWEPTELDEIRVGQVICRLAEEHGFDVTWNGNPATRVTIQ